MQILESQSKILLEIHRADPCTRLGWRASEQANVPHPIPRSRSITFIDSSCPGRAWRRRSKQKQGVVMQSWSQQDKRQRQFEAAFWPGLAHRWNAYWAEADHHKNPSKYQLSTLCSAFRFNLKNKTAATNSNCTHLIHRSTAQTRFVYNPLHALPFPSPIVFFPSTDHKPLPFWHAYSGRFGYSPKVPFSSEHHLREREGKNVENLSSTFQGF